MKKHVSFFPHFFFQVWSDISSKEADQRTIFPIIKQRTEAAVFLIELVFCVSDNNNKALP